MAHYEKYHQTDVIGLLCHDNRTLKTKRENIDDSRSYLNYNLHNVKNEYEFYKNKLEFVKKNGGTVREDSVTMCSIIVTLPQNFPQNEELEKQFFNACYNLICDDFKKENVISAWVHRDETSNHIHLKILPVLEKDKSYKNGEVKKRLSLNANKIVDRNYLQKFHNRLEEYIEDYIGFKPEILNGATKLGNKTKEELKAIENSKKELEEIINSAKSEKDVELFVFRKKENKQKEIINDLWKEYQEKSNNYWNSYKICKQNINNDIFEIKKNVESAKYQLAKDLDFFNNLQQGLIFAVLRLLCALMTYFINYDLNEQIKALEQDLEALNEVRRSVSGFQNSSKNALKKEDIEKVEKCLNNWENSIKKSDEIIRSYFMKKETLNKIINKENEKIER